MWFRDPQSAGSQTRATSVKSFDWFNLPVVISSDSEVFKIYKPYFKAEIVWKQACEYIVF